MNSLPSVTRVQTITKHDRHYIYPAMCFTKHNSFFPELTRALRFSIGCSLNNHKRMLYVNLKRKMFFLANDCRWRPAESPNYVLSKRKYVFLQTFAAGGLLNGQIPYFKQKKYVGQTVAAGGVLCGQNITLVFIEFIFCLLCSNQGTPVALGIIVDVVLMFSSLWAFMLDVEVLNALAMLLKVRESLSQYRI